MPHEVLKAFSYSEDGVSAIVAAIGDEPEIPAALIAGLIAEGYIAETKSLGAAPENKMLAAAPENKARDPLDHDGDGRKGGSVPAGTDDLTDEEINADIMAMPSVDFDPREPKAERLAKRNAGRAARDAKA